MSFIDIVNEWDNFDFDGFFKAVTDADILRAISKETLTKQDFLTLLSPKAAKHLEFMAQKANALTLQHFGKAKLLYAPLYIANYCENQCIYCGFNCTNHIKRKKLTFDEVREESEALYDLGIRNILVLTGESRAKSPVDYIADCLKIIHEKFSSIGIEVYELTTQEYKQLVDAGADSFCMYQETYDRDVYKSVHLRGPKMDYQYRLDAPERACKAGMRSVNIGALLGLSKWRKDFFFTGLHADYLQNNYPEVEISVSPPRMRPHVGSYQPVEIVTDADIVQIITAFRLFMPRAGISVSTRERAEFRDNLLPLGVTKISAESSTEVGGYAHKNTNTPQFDISDDRTVKDVQDMLIAKGYQPVYHDWY